MRNDQLIDILQRFPADAEVGVCRGLYFAPLCEVESRGLNEKFPGMVDRFPGETDDVGSVLQLTFLSNSEVADRAADD